MNLKEIITALMIGGSAFAANNKGREPGKPPELEKKLSGYHRIHQGYNKPSPNDYKFASEGLKEMWDKDLATRLGNNVKIKITSVKDEVYVIPAYFVDKEKIKEYSLNSIEEFNKYLGECPVKKYVPEISFPETEEELRAMRYPNIYWLGSKKEINIYKIKMKGKETLEEVLTRVRTDKTGGMTDKKINHNRKTGETIVKFAPCMAFTEISSYNTDVFDPSPLYQYAYSLVAQISADKFTARIKNKNYSNEECQEIMDQVSKEEKKFVEALVDNFLIDYLKEKNIPMEGYIKNYQNALELRREGIHQSFLDFYGKSYIPEK